MDASPAQQIYRPLISRLMALESSDIDPQITEPLYSTTQYCRGNTRTSSRVFGSSALPYTVLTSTHTHCTVLYMRILWPRTSSTCSSPTSVLGRHLQAAHEQKSNYLRTVQYILYIELSVSRYCSQILYCTVQYSTSQATSRHSGIW